VETVELAPPGDGEVRVQLRYGGVNPIDRYVAQGLVAAEGPLPRTLGGEAAGTLDDGTAVVGEAEVVITPRQAEQLQALGYVRS